MKYPRNQKNAGLAKGLRKNLTPQERHLWYDFLKFLQPRFRRQELLGNYIADFFCYDAKLVVEIDGSGHYEPAAIEKDNMRTAYFHALGLKVLRFSNADVNMRFDSVCEAILIALEHCGVEAVVKTL